LKYVAGVCKTWELGDAVVAKRFIRDLAKRMDREAPGVLSSVVEGLNKFLAALCHCWP
jgi:hypothetical protein